MKASETEKKPRPITSNPQGVSPPPPTYRHVCTFELNGMKLITVAGQIGTDKEGNLPAGFIDQVKNAHENVRLCLESVGATVRDIVQVKVLYLSSAWDKTGKEEQEEQDRLYLEWLGDHRPPGTRFFVDKMLPEGMLFEIEVMAVLAV